MRTQLQADSAEARRPASGSGQRRASV